MMSYIRRADLSSSHCMFPIFFFSGPLIVTWLTTGCLWICTLAERSTQLCTYSMLGFSAIFAMT